ncbi:MAG: hypothetical protein Kow0059_17800 [Candidatus Sumerlaeia bacterium]
MNPDNLELLKQEFEKGTSRRAYIAYADALRRGKQLQQALAVCQQGLQTDPASLTGRSLLARIYYDMGRYDSSIEVLRGIVEREPMALQSRMLLVKALLRKRQIDEAAAECARLQELIPDDERVQLLARDIRRIKARLQQSPGSPQAEVQEIRSVAGYQNRIHQLKKAFAKSPFIEDVGLLSAAPLSGPDGSVSTGGLLSGLIEQIRKPIGEAGFGAVKTAQWELEGAIIVLYAVEDDFLYVRARPECKIGRLRYQVESVLCS